MEFYATICRLCESPDQKDQTGPSWVELFSDKNNSEHLLAKIRAFVNIAIYDNDGLPKRICGRCSLNVETAYNFKMQCEITDAKLRHEMEFLNKSGKCPEVSDYSRFLVGAQEDKKPNLGELVEDKIIVKAEAEEGEDVKRPLGQVLSQEDSDEDFCATKVETQLKVEEEVSGSDESDNEDDSDVGHQTEESSDEMELEKVVKKCNICDICGEQFDKRSNLHSHKRTVHGKQQFQCKQCLKIFSRKSRLVEHELQHSGIRQFECSECDKKYTTQNGLKVHMEDIHSDNLPWVCDKCGKGFSKESKLRYHYAVHIETRNFICELCQKGFKTQAHLNLHKTTHLPPDKKKKRPPRDRRKTCVCPFCGKVSESIGTHSMHIRTHTGDQRYECHICSKRFTSSGSHKKHLRVHTGEKPYVCEYCQKAFRQKHHMDTHIRGVHTNEKPYQCKVCPRAFATLGNMRLHERSHGEPAGKPEPLVEPYSVDQSESVGMMIDSPASQSSSMMVNSTPSPMMNPGVVIPPGLGVFITDRMQ